MLAQSFLASVQPVGPGAGNVPQIAHSSGVSLAGHGADLDGPLFRPLRPNGKRRERALPRGDAINPRVQRDRWNRQPYSSITR
jgi:hypothetical protein